MAETLPPRQRITPGAGLGEDGSGIAGVTKPALRGFIHLLAFSSALTLAPILIVSTPGLADRFIVAGYALSIVALFGVSALYHRVDWEGPAAARMRKLDHSMIFIAIAATHTPVALIAMPPGPGWTLFTIVWVGAVVGILSRVFLPQAPAWLVAAPYVLVGWSSLVVVNHVWNAVDLAGFILLLVGGLFYTAGAVIFALKRPDPWPDYFGFHEIFHVCTVAGAACHYLTIAFFLRPF